MNRILQYHSTEYKTCEVMYTCTTYGTIFIADVWISSGQGISHYKPGVYL